MSKPGSGVAPLTLVSRLAVVNSRILILEGERAKFFSEQDGVISATWPHQSALEHSRTQRAELEALLRQA